MSWAMNGQSRFLAGPTYLHQPFLLICSPCCISASSLGISHGRRKEDACFTHETAGVGPSLGDRRLISGPQRHGPPDLKELLPRPCLAVGKQTSFDF